jgi:hypothetical protein
LEDPYDAVRFIAARTLRGLPHFGDMHVDFTASPQELSIARQRVWSQWERLQEKREKIERRSRRAILIDDSGGLMRSELERLLEQRDNREIHLSE